MGTVTGYILVLDSNRLNVLENHQIFANEFAEPVEDFSHSRNVPLVCFINDQTGLTKYLALGRRGLSAGTSLRRLNLFDIEKLNIRVYLSELINVIPPSLRWRIAPKIRNGGLLTKKQFQTLVDLIVSRYDELGALLKKYSSVRENRIKALSSRACEELAFQKEAVATAIGIAGLSRSCLQSWNPPKEGSPTSFLDGIDQTRLREDQMVIHDMNNVPGYSAVREMVQGAAVFQGEDGSRLTVILANRLPLEQLTGADLIYFNEAYKSFVLVQYKAMEKKNSEEPIYRLPDAQLSAEIQRMDEILSVLEKCPNTKDHSSYRFFQNPFFLKLCSRIVFNPDDVSLVPGMYIPLEQWKLLENDESLIGKRGGRGITFENVTRHIENTHFIRLVSEAWVGTTPAQSKILKEAIRSTIESGRAAVLAVKKER